MDERSGEMAVRQFAQSATAAERLDQVVERRGEKSDFTDGVRGALRGIRRSLRAVKSAEVQQHPSRARTEGSFGLNETNFADQKNKLQTVRSNIHLPCIKLRLVSSQRTPERMIVSNYEASIVDLRGEVEILLFVDLRLLVLYK
jgi:hypothetical protein